MLEAHKWRAGSGRAGRAVVQPSRKLGLKERVEEWEGSKGAAAGFGETEETGGQREERLGTRPTLAHSSPVPI